MANIFFPYRSLPVWLTKWRFSLGSTWVIGQNDIFFLLTTSRMVERHRAHNYSVKRHRIIAIFQLANFPPLSYYKEFANFGSCPEVIQDNSKVVWHVDYKDLILFEFMVFSWAVFTFYLCRLLNFDWWNGLHNQNKYTYQFIQTKAAKTNICTMAWWIWQNKYMITTRNFIKLRGGHGGELNNISPRHVKNRVSKSLVILVWASILWAMNDLLSGSKVPQQRRHLLYKLLVF